MYVSCLRLRGGRQFSSETYACAVNCCSFYWMGKHFQKKPRNAKLVLRVMIPGIDSWFPIKMEQRKVAILKAGAKCKQGTSLGWPERETNCFWEQDTQSQKTESKWGRSQAVSVTKVSTYPQKGSFLISRADGISPGNTCTLLSAASLKDLTSSWGRRGRELSHGHNHRLSAV